MLVSANVGGSSFNEVTFYVKVGNGGWTPIGTDDTRPYRVYHDVSSLATGTRLSYRAVVLDNAGHIRTSEPVEASVPAPKVTMLAPAEGASVFGTILVQATVDLKRVGNVVSIQRSLNGGAWQTLTTDSSSPIYSYYDNLASVPVGTVIRYRAVLVGTGVVSAIRTVTRTQPVPLVNSVTVAGSLQSEIGCAGDWDPACAASHLTFDTDDGLWKGTFTLPPGNYEYKVAINDSWDVNYGAGGAAGGSNIPLTVPTGTTSVTFVWDQVSHVVTHTLNS
jgi:alpha-amylase